MSHTGHGLPLEGSNGQGSFLQLKQSLKGMADKGFLPTAFASSQGRRSETVWSRVSSSKNMYSLNKQPWLLLGLSTVQHKNRKICLAPLTTTRIQNQDSSVFKTSSASFLLISHLPESQRKRRPSFTSVWFLILSILTHIFPFMYSMYQSLILRIFHYPSPPITSLHKNLKLSWFQ